MRPLQRAVHCVMASRRLHLAAAAVLPLPPPVCSASAHALGRPTHHLDQSISPPFVHHSSHRASAVRSPRSAFTPLYYCCGCICPPFVHGRTAVQRGSSACLRHSLHVGLRRSVPTPCLSASVAVLRSAAPTTARLLQPLQRACVPMHACCVAFRDSPRPAVVSSYLCERVRVRESPAAACLAVPLGARTSRTPLVMKASCTTHVRGEPLDNPYTSCLYICVCPAVIAFVGGAYGHLHPRSTPPLCHQPAWTCASGCCSCWVACRRDVSGGTQQPVCLAASLTPLTPLLLLDLPPSSGHWYSSALLPIPI